jgi:TetR/AcrR family transcriptional repressor of nem operon
MSNDLKQTRRQQSHERILDAAARALCRDGYAGLGVANVMKEAGLTHGGFYAHFDSREALLAEAVEHAGMRSMARMRERLARRVDEGVSPLRALIEEYLSDAHVNAFDACCPVAALGPDLGRGEAGLRETALARVQHLVGAIAKLLPRDSAPGAAQLIAATLVGSIQLARVLPEADREAMLQNARASLLAQFDRAELGAH